jgi:hypothetical protein
MRETAPNGIAVMVRRTRAAAIEHDEVELTVAGKIHELRRATRDAGVWSARDEFDRCKRGMRALDALFSEEIDGLRLRCKTNHRLLGEDSGEPFTLEIDPL